MNSLKDSFLRSSYFSFNESDLLRNSPCFTLSSNSTNYELIDKNQNFQKNLKNYDDEEYNLNYCIDLNRQEMEKRLKNESDYDMRIFCIFF
jgi:hypothetical protein